MMATILHMLLRAHVKFWQHPTINKKIFSKNYFITVSQSLYPKINDLLFKRSTNQHWEILENTIWPPVWSIASEVDKTKQQLLKQNYRKPLTRKSINTPAPPIETSVITSLCVWGITSHCPLPIHSASASHEKQSLTAARVSRKWSRRHKWKQGTYLLLHRGHESSHLCHRRIWTPNISL